MIWSSPFDTFTRYEAELGLPADTVRRLKATNPDTNAWARLERSEIDRDEFCALVEAEGRATGVELSGARLIESLYGDSDRRWSRPSGGWVPATRRRASRTTWPEGFDRTSPRSWPCSTSSCRAPRLASASLSPGSTRSLERGDIRVGERVVERRQAVLGSVCPTLGKPIDVEFTARCFPGKRRLNPQRRTPPQARAPGPDPLASPR